MKLAGVIFKLFILTGFGFVAASCSHKAVGEMKAHFDPPTKFSTTFYPGIPDDMQGLYYDSQLTSDPYTDDEFYKLILNKDSVKLKHMGVKGYDKQYENIYYHKISRGHYVFKTGDYSYYFKVDCTGDGGLKVYDYQMRYSDALRASKFEVFTSQTPDDSFGTSAYDMEHKFYVSDRDFTRYYELDNYGFDNPLTRLLLWKVNDDGTESILCNYESLVAKKGRYNLLSSGDDYTSLLQIGDSQLLDAESGETFSLYTGDLSPKEEVWRALGITMKPPVS
ncbi:hypothetical protein [Companilactobacillus furfuricola]|uniref:hypothetical protein n=1 Tax=Companilactobacillus furfuricola TaxID=1462575 RepID=UPI000F7792F0|nr:hypothetical protein [Companilactobacillus furfuricola]